LSGNNARINLQANVPLAASSITYAGTNGNNVPIYMDAGTINLGGGAGSIATTGGVTSYLHVNGNVTLNLASANLTYLWLKSGGGAPAQLSITNGQTFSAVITYLAGIPASGQSMLNLNGGTLNAGTMIFNVTTGAYSNTFNLNSGGLLTADTIRRDFDGTSLAFNWNDGTIRNRTNASLTISRGANATQDMVLSLAGTGTHTFNVDSGRTITLASTAALADKAGEQGTLVKAGAGELIFSGNNSYTGDTTVLGGTLTLNSGQGLSDTGAVTLSNTSGVTLKVNASETIGSLRGGGTTGGNITLAEGQNLTIVQADDQTFGGQITGAGGLVKAGAGKLSLTRDNGGSGFAGGVTIDGGTLTSVNSGATLGMGATDTWGGGPTTTTALVTINAGGNMTSDNQFNTLRDLTLNGGNVTLNGGHPAGAFGFGGTLTVGGSTPSTITTTTGSNNLIRLGRQGTNESTTFDVSDPNGQLLVDAALHNTFDFPSGLTKTGSGKLVLASNNIYSGPTTISGGTLQVGNGGTNGTLGTAATGIAVSSGAILSFNRTDNYGGNFTRNLSGAGTVAINGGNLTLNAGGSSGYSTNLSFVVNNGATATMGHSDMFGGTGWDATTSPGFTVNAGGTLASSNNFNTLWNLNLNGGTLLANGGANSPAQAFALAGTVTVGGSSAS
ncbi:MAG: hypothetical protein EBZ53_06945, partial [Verrucomicrobia bacterium]|nr:hypothetical protein [Verrucomicrobiota bacterium]